MLGHGSGPGHTTQARQGPLKTAPISRHDYVCMSMKSEFKVIENNALPSTIIFMKLVGSRGGAETAAAAAAAISFLVHASTQSA